VSANTWTTLEFTNATEFCTNFSGGNSVLATGKGTLEHLAIVPDAGAGAYTIHVDNFEVVMTPAVSGTISMNSGSVMTLTASATDPDPGSGLNFGLDADAPTGAAIDMNTGVFSWTPSAATSNNITVSVNDNPTNGAIAKTTSSTFTVVVSTDPLGPQSSSGVTAGGSGESVTLTWDAVPGTTYQVQSKNGADGAWANVGGPITAEDSSASAEVAGSGSETYYRIVTVDGGGTDQ
jgi:hypothetical protein